MINKKILITILAGGLSSRFGFKTKTFAKINGMTILQKIINNLKYKNMKIIINTNSSEKNFINTNLPLVKDLRSDFQGPLAGIYSSMMWSKKNKLDVEWILSVPSDTPFLPKNLADIFISKIKKNTKILIARSENKIHPVIGFWHLSLINSLKEELDSNNRKIMNWVSKNKFEYVDFPVNKYDPFFNINNKADLIEAKKMDKLISQLSE